MRYGLAPVVLGLACGLLLSLALGGLLRGLVSSVPALWRVSATRVMGMDPASILHHE